MATAGRSNPWVVSMQSGQAGAMACRPSSSCALLLHRASAGLSLVASPSSRFISILSSSRSRTPLTVLAIHAQDPDFYKIPYVEGIPVGKRLKLWNLPPNCKHNELLEWFAGIDVKVESLEFTNDPVLNAQGIGGFVEFATKQHACIAIVRLDGYKFRGHYIRMDFAEKRPHSRDYGSRRSRPNRSSSSSSGGGGSRGSFAMSSPPVTDMVPSYGGTTSGNAQLTPSYEAVNSSAVQASSGYGSSTQSTNAQLTPRHEAASSSAVQTSSDYSSSVHPSRLYHNSASNSEGIQSNPSYGNAQSPLGFGSTSHPAGHGVTQAPPTPSSSVSGSTSPPLNTQSAPSYGNTSDFSSTKSSPGSVQPSYGEAQPSARSFTTKAAPSAYDGSMKSPVGTVSNSGQSNSDFGNNSTQIASSMGKSTIPQSYGNNSPHLASSMGKSTIQSGSSYGSIKDTDYGNSISESFGDSSPPSVTQSSPSVDSQSVSSYGNTGMQLSTIATQSSFDSLQMPSDFSSTKSSPESVSIPSQPSYSEVQASARSFTTQAAPIAYDGSKKSHIGTVSNNGHTSPHRAVAQGHPPSSPNSRNATVDPYDDIFKNYGAPDAAEVEPWLMNTSFRSGPMFGSPQPSSLNRLFVGNLAVSIDDAALQELFSKFGTVLEARVLRNQESGRSRGFAVVAMSSVDEVKAASKALDGWRVESRPLKVDAVTSKH